ncbi:MAG: biopolymer transporter ExbD [Verrucomicrobiales bacterium]|jgi:biopolymer transport protein ExbD|nr:biopolymer transporter ExbD [Verrucomicrobiales bacterium]
MQFRPRQRRSAPSVIIISLIDVLMVVLIFLVVSTTFKDRLPTIDLALPDSRTQDLTAAGDGPLSIQIKALPPHWEINGKVVTTFEMERIFRAHATEKPDVTLIIQSDKAAPFGAVVTARDTARVVGITNVSAQVKIPAER